MNQRGATPKPVAAKFARPRLEHVSLRLDTLAAFKGATKRRLTVVCAPAGYGKTTAAAAALEQLALRAIWYKLDGMDRDPAAFVGALVEAFQQRFPAFGEVILERLHAGADVPFPVEHMLAMFVHECGERVSVDVHVFLDDYHEAADSAPLNHALDYVLANAPQNIRFVVLTRYDPAFLTARMRLQDEVGVLSVDLLRFDSDQAAAVLAARLGRETAARHVGRLLELTEGWPASIVLAALALEWLDFDSVESALADPRLRKDVYSYLAEEVYRREDVATCDFLRRTCCLEYITAELANRIAGIDDAHLHLNHLSANRVFTFATGERGVYRYHNLFRDYLQQRFLKEEGEPAFRELQRQTANALEACGEIEMAVELLLTANEPLAALEAIAKVGEPGLDGFRSDSLSSWLTRLRPALETPHPWARLMAAQVLSRTGDFDAALAETRLAAAAFAAGEDEWGLYTALSMTECMLFWKGDIAEAQRTCEQALAHAHTDAQRMHTLLSLGSAALEARDWSATDQAFAAAQALEDRANPAERARAQALRAHAAYFKGAFREALAEFAILEPNAVSATLLPWLFNTQGLAEAGLARYETAVSTLEQARRAGQRSGQTLAVAFVDDNIGLVRGAQGDHQGGLALIRGVAATHEIAVDPTLLAVALSHEATLLRRAQRPDEALAPCIEAAGLVPIERDPYLALNGGANLLFTRSLLEEDLSGDLLEVSRKAEARQLRFVALKAELYAAILAGEKGDESSSSQILSHCIPRQLDLGHIHLVAQELCPRPALALTTLTAIEGTSPRSELLEALAVHWRFGVLFETLADHDEELGAAAIRAAAKSSTDAVLADVLTLANAMRSSRMSMEAEAASAQRGVTLQRGSKATGGLTRREAQVLQLMAQGKNNAELAAELFLAPATVKTHINHIFTKLEVSTRVQAVLKYRETLDG
jgi:LuxR family maltose regulon positive regulatory protein